MRPWIAARTLAAALSLAGCARSVPPPPPLLAVAGDATSEAAAVRAAVYAFVSLEARGDERADTLLAAGADFIASGIAITNRPRLAGMLGRGEGSVEAAWTQLAGDHAWAVVIYRWAGRAPELAERARATFVLERRPAGWRIRHVHSSAVARWEP